MHIKAPIEKAHETLKGSKGSAGDTQREHRWAESGRSFFKVSVAFFHAQVHAANISCLYGLRTADLLQTLSLCRAHAQKSLSQRLPAVWGRWQAGIDYYHYRFTGQVSLQCATYPDPRNSSVRR